jgi:hypothetical protein
MTYQPRTVWVGGSPYANVPPLEKPHYYANAIKEREAMLEYIKDHPGCSRVDVVKHVVPHLDRKTYDRRIRLMCDAGLMTKTLVLTRYGTQQSAVMQVARYHANT